MRQNLLQRKCACGQHTGGAECAECRRKHLRLQRRAVRSDAPVSVPPIVHEVLRSPGRPLDPATRAFMEPRFGHDFSRVPLQNATPRIAQSSLTVGPVNDRFEHEADRVAETVMEGPVLNTSIETGTQVGHDFSHVRVHTDARAAESARAVNARAYTVGRDVVFGARQYAPGTIAGEKLIAHELAHVVQQHGSGHALSVQRQPIAPAAPNYRYCTPAISGLAVAIQ